MNQALPRIEFANTKQQVSRIGFGCMGLSAFYGGANFTEEEGIEIVGKAISQGLNFFDTAYLYGKNEELMNKAIKKYGREKFFLATKVPPMLLDEKFNMTPIPKTKENIKKYCYESLQRLGVEQIDLYYQHRIDATIPIETQAEAFKELIEEGKIRFYGLSEASEDTIRRAHKIHPVTAVQEEYSLFTRDIETNGVLNTCKELGIALVAYSPLGRGILTGNFKLEELEANDSRKMMPRYHEEHIKKNQELVEQLRGIATSLNCTAGQLALGWLLTRGNHVIPIPGTKREKYLTENNGAAFVEIPAEVLQKLDSMFPAGIASGDRYPEQFKQTTNVTTVQL